jgi:hypothetical protein
MYDKSPSPAIYEIWFNSLRRFELEAIRKAFSVYIQSPDAGRFMPKPADIIKIIEGTSLDAAYVAWSKTEKAVQRVGSYSTVVFDDPIIHSVIKDMGGWIKLCQTQENKLPFASNEFRQRYHGFKTQGTIPEYPGKLIGITEAENTANGFLDHIQPPTLIGDQDSAKHVMACGSNKPALKISYPSSQVSGMKKIPSNNLKVLAGGAAKTMEA